MSLAKDVIVEAETVFFVHSKLRPTLVVRPAPKQIDCYSNDSLASAWKYEGVLFVETVTSMIDNSYYGSIDIVEGLFNYYLMIMGKFCQTFEEIIFL